MSNAAHSEVFIPPLRFVQNKEKSFIGDFGFGYWSAQHRSPLFLPSNFKNKSLGQHDHAVISRDPTSISPRTNPPTHLPFRNVSAQSTPTRGLATMQSRRSSGKGETPSGGSSARRSTRTRTEKPWEHDDAALVVSQFGIRKKLNFKENLSIGGRPAKRVKRAPEECLCSLAIWDNRPSAADKPLVAETRQCFITKTEAHSSGGEVFLDVRLEKAFVVPASKLKVPSDKIRPEVQTVVDNYFLEIKIFPENDRVVWPPIPILGKQGGPLYGRGSKPEVQGQQRFLVASYQKLPEAPPSDVALSVAFFESGASFLTKYGLSITSEWLDGGALLDSNDAPESGGEEEMKLPDTPVHDAHDVVNQYRRTRAKDREQPAETPSQTSSTRAASQPRVRVQIRYEWYKAGSKVPDQSFSLEGFQCPMCRIPKFPDFAELHRHLNHIHANLQFSWNERPISDQPVQVYVLKVMHTALEKDEEKDSKEWYHESTKEPSGISRSELRAQNNGFLPAEFVPDFRKPRRRRYCAVNLGVNDGQVQPMYTSISHRPILQDEGSRSETEDEIDDEWLIERQLETLELQAKKHGKSDFELELWKRWERHRMEEKLEHSRFLSDCLVRFVRKNTEWLRRGNDIPELLLTFYDFLAELKQRRVIDNNIVADVIGMIFPPRPGIKIPSPTTSPNTIVVTSAHTVERTPKPPLTMHIMSGETEHFRRPFLDRSKNKGPNATSSTALPLNQEVSHPPARLEPAALLSLPPGLCGMCHKVVPRLLKHSIRCTKIACQSPAVPYHRKCVKIAADHDQTDWSCGVCVERLRAEKGKDKEVEATPKVVDSVLTLTPTPSEKLPDPQLALRNLNTGATASVEERQIITNGQHIRDEVHRKKQRENMFEAHEGRDRRIELLKKQSEAAQRAREREMVEKGANDVLRGLREGLI